jgi:hypothetical protein
MQSLVRCAYFIVVFGSTSLARGDGLIFQLPSDGSWARFAVKTDGTQQIEGLTHTIATTWTLTVSSVGRVTQNQQASRWIELKTDATGEGVYPKLVLKMLIPEKRLQRGHDPLAYSLKTFFDPKPMDEKKAPLVESFIDDGFNRIQYEIDRFRMDFPRPLYNSKTLEKETIETPAGRFEDCEVLTGTSSYDGPLVQDGRSVFRGNYRIVVHPKAPFGVVSMQVESEGREFGDDQVLRVKVKRTLLLNAVGENAVSALKAKAHNSEHQATD